MSKQLHLLYVWTPKGYLLEEREGEPPLVGSLVAADGGAPQLVSKIAASPLPGDARRCAYLQPA